MWHHADANARRNSVTITDRREFFENVVYHNVARRRFTQQSPVMPDVWIQYGLRPGTQCDLLMVADWHYTPTQLAASLNDNLARDHSNLLVYIAPTRVNLSLTEERWPDVEFRKTREH